MLAPNSSSLLEISSFIMRVRVRSVTTVVIPIVRPRMRKKTFPFRLRRLLMEISLSLITILMIHHNDAEGAKKEFLVCPAKAGQTRRTFPKGFDFWPKARGPSGESVSPDSPEISPLFAFSLPTGRQACLERVPPARDEWAVKFYLNYFLLTIMY